MAPFYLPYLLPVLQLTSIAAHHAGAGAWWANTWHAAALGFCMIPLLEGLLPHDNDNPTEDATRAKADSIWRGRSLVVCS